MERLKIENKNLFPHFSTYGLALFFLLTPFEYPLADLMAVSPLRLVGLAAMALAALDIFLQWRLKIDYRFLCVAMLLFYGFVSYIWTLDRARFESYYSIYFNNALMFLLFTLISFTQREVAFLKNSMIYGVGALLLYMTFVPGAIIYSDYENRLTLNAGKDGLDQNYLAALMLIAFGLVFYKLCNDKEQKKIYKVISSVFCLAVVYYIFLTGSRSGLLAILLIVMLSINTSWKTRLYIGIPIAAVIIGVLPLLSQFVPEELLQRFSLKAITGQEAESETRFIIWRHTLQSIRDFKWVFGCGVGSSQTLVGNILGMGKDMAIHNHYLAMIVEFGLVGSLFINIPIFKMDGFLFKKDKCMGIAFIGILIMAFFIDVITTKFFWADMILLSACAGVRHEKPVESENLT